MYTVEDFVLSAFLVNDKYFSSLLLNLYISYFPVIKYTSVLITQVTKCVSKI